MDLWKQFKKEKFDELKKNYTGYGYEFQNYVKSKYIEWLEERVRTLESVLKEKTERAEELTAKNRKLREGIRDITTLKQIAREALNKGKL